MFSAQASHQDFSAFTDFYYVNLGVNGTANKLSSVTGPFGHVTVPVGLQLQTGTGMGLTAWTLGGGYRFAHGDWGEIEGIAGARLLDVTSSTHYTLSADVTGPLGGLALEHNGSLSAGGSFWDGIIGVKGRFNLANSGFFVPYYLDIGTGALPLTWQAYAGVGYSWKWFDVSAGWRVLDYQKSGTSSVENVSLNGLIAAANFRF
jgi:hypothetical protein